MTPDEFDNALADARRRVVAAGFIAYSDDDHVLEQLVAAMNLPSEVLVVKTLALDPDEPLDCPAAPPDTPAFIAPERRIESPPEPVAANDPERIKAERAPASIRPQDFTDLVNTALKRGLTIEPDGLGLYLLRRGRPSKAEVLTGATLDVIASFLARDVRPSQAEPDIEDLRRRLGDHGYRLRSLEPGRYTIACGSLDVYSGTCDEVRAFAYAKILGRAPDPRLADYREDQ